jgi:PAS domain S-box-containing protein
MPIESNRLIALLASFASEVASVESTSQLAAALMRVVEQVVEVTYSGFYFLDPTTGRLRLLASRGLSDEEAKEAERTAGQRHPMHVVRTGETFLSQDTESEGDISVSSLRSFVVRSRLYIPVMVQGRTVGCLGLGASLPGAFTERHVVMLEFSASVAGAVYDRIAGREDSRQRNERLAMVVSGAELGLWDWDIGSGDVDFNDRWSTMLGYQPGEVDGNVSEWEKLVHPDDWESVEEALRGHLVGSTDFYRSVHRLRTKEGRWCWVVDAGRVYLRDDLGNPLRAAGIHLDVSAEKEAQRELRDYKIHLEELVERRTRELKVAVDELGREVETRRAAEERLADTLRRLRAAGEHAARMEESQRRRIARLVHDEIGQELTLLRLHVQRAGNADRRLLAAHLAQIDERLRALLRLARDITADLSPVVLHQLGLNAALRDLAERIESQHHLCCSFNPAEDDSWLSDDLRLLVFQGAKELMHNAVKHSGATQLSVSLSAPRKMGVALVVEDNGRGISELAGREAGRGHGLFSLAERVENVGGDLEFDESEGGGARVSFRVPALLGDTQGGGPYQEVEN